MTPFRERMAELLDDPAELDRILAEGAARAREVGRGDGDRVYDAVGLLPPAKSVRGHGHLRRCHHGPRALRTILQERREEFGDPLAAAIPPHVTLLPPTEIAPRRDGLFADHLRCVVDDAGRSRCASWHRHLPARVACRLRPGVERDPECERLERAVRSGPVERDLEFNYHPHVTVAHHLGDEALDRAYASLADFEASFECRRSTCTSTARTRCGGSRAGSPSTGMPWAAVGGVPASPTARRGSVRRSSDPAPAVSLLARLRHWVRRGVVQPVGDGWRRFRRTRLGRAWTRYGEVRGNLLAGGVAYFAFFSIFPAIALAATVFGVLLRGHPQWLAGITDYLDATLPGFVKHGDTGLIPLGVPSGGTLGGLGVVGALVLLWSGLGWLGALRDGIRAVLGVRGAPGNAVTTKLRDLVVLVVLGVGIAASAAASGITAAAAGWLAGHLGLGSQSWPVSVVGFVVSAALDAALVVVMLRLLSGVDLPREALYGGSLAGGTGLTVLKVVGTALVRGTLHNPLYASIALVVGLLAWLNLMSRVVLLASAWSATYLPPEPAPGTAEAPGTPGAR